MNVDAFAAQPCNGGTNHVDHAKHLTALEFDFLDSGNGVSRFSGLRHGKIDGFWIDDGIVVSEFA